MKKSGFILVIFILLAALPISSRAQHIRKVQFTILVYGMPPEQLRVNAENIIADQWGIVFFPVAGCVVSSDLKDSVSLHNEAVYAQLEAINGKDWQVRFYKEIEEEYKREKEVMKLIQSHKAVQQKINSQEDAMYFRYEMTPLLGTSQYDVWVTNYEEWENNNSIVTYFKLKVDLASQSIKIVSEEKQLYKSLK